MLHVDAKMIRRLDEIEDDLGETSGTCK